MNEQGRCAFAWGPDSSIYWHPDLGAHEIYGAIREKWASLGWERGVVGYPAGAEAPAHGGAVQPFRGGFIAWHPSIGAGRNGAHEVHGSIGARWNALGETDFGFPITGARRRPDLRLAILAEIRDRRILSKLVAIVRGAP